MNKNLLILILLVVFAACSESPKTKKPILEVDEQTTIVYHQLILDAISAHGGANYDSANYQFEFRGITYRFHNHQNGYQYERKGVIKGDSIHDVLVNGKLTRVLNGVQVELSEVEEAKYSESINSVIYFATLPHKLKDAAVIATEMTETEVFNKSYRVLKVTFRQEGGGTDFDDEYYYWVNSETKEIDFLAYNYQVNGGGVRFREAYNKRRVGGILFQDYVNYKAAVGIALADLPNLLENKELEELSKIESKDIKSIR